MVGLSTFWVLVLGSAFVGGLNFKTPWAVSFANSSGVRTSGFFLRRKFIFEFIVVAISNTTVKQAKSILHDHA